MVTLPHCLTVDTSHLRRRRWLQCGTPRSPLHILATATPRSPRLSQLPSATVIARWSIGATIQLVSKHRLPCRTLSCWGCSTATARFQHSRCAIAAAVVATHNICYGGSRILDSSCTHRSSHAISNIAMSGLPHPSLLVPASTTTGVAK